MHATVTTQSSSTQSQNSHSHSVIPEDRVIVVEQSECKVVVPPTPPVTQSSSLDSKKSVISTPVSVLVRVPPHIPPAIPASIAAPNAQVPSALPVPGHIQGRQMPIPSIPTPAIVSSPNATSPPSFMATAKQVMVHRSLQIQLSSL